MIERRKAHNAVASLVAFARLIASSAVRFGRTRRWQAGQQPGSITGDRTLSHVLGRRRGRNPIVTFLTLAVLLSFVLVLGAPKSSRLIATPTSLGPIALAGNLSSWNTQIDDLDLSAVACTSVLNCIAVGDSGTNNGLVYVTANGGKTWTEEPVPSGTGPISSVACDPSTAADCYATTAS